VVGIAILLVFFGQTRSGPSAKVDKQNRGVSLSGLEVIQTGSGGTSLRFGLQNLDVDDVYIEGEPRHQLGFEDSEPYGEIGSPSVPVLRKLIAIPECKKIEIDYEVVSQSEIQNVDVFPYPRTIWNGVEGARQIYQKDNSIYTRNEHFPGESVNIVKIGYVRGQRLALVEIAPVHYNPVTNEVRVIEEIEIQIRTVDAEGGVFKNTGPMSAILSETVINSSYGGALMAPGIDMLSPTSGTAEYKWCGGSSATTVADSVIAFGADYLIVVAEELAEDSADSVLVDSLAAHRVNYNGFNVAIVTLDQLDSTADTTATPDSIRTMIKKVYESESAPHMGDDKLAFVLLIGDAWNPDGNIVIPTYQGFQQSTGDKESRGSDAYYSLLDDDADTDPFPDIYIGRLPVDSDNDDWELGNVVAKITNYEPLPDDENWTDKILLTSGSKLLGSPNNAWYDPYFDYVTSNAIPATKTVHEIHRLLDFSTDVDCGEAIADSLTKGYWTAAFIGHGNVFNMQWTLSPMHGDTLQNSTIPFLSINMCQTGWFDYLPAVDDTAFCPAAPGYGCTDESWSGPSNFACNKPPSNVDACDALTERLVVQENGAVAVFAYTRNYGEESAKNDFFNYFKALYSENTSTLGEVLLSVKFLQASNNRTIYNYTLFGDPALNVKWKDVEHDSVDVAVGSSGIRGRNGTVYVNSGESDLLHITVQNIARNDAIDVPMEIWRGHPDSTSSTRLDSVVIDEIGAYSEITYDYSTTFIDPGVYKIFVSLDPDSTIDERSKENNLAQCLIFALPYHNSNFPVKLNGEGHHSVTIKDVHTQSGEEVLLCTKSDIRCYSTSNGTKLWRFKRYDQAGHWDLRNNPLIANLNKDDDRYVLYHAKKYSYVYVLDASDGSVADSIAVNDSSMTVHYGISYAVGDFKTGNNELEFVTFQNDNLTAFELDGDVIWSNDVTSLMPHFNAFSSMATGDIDGNGDTEIVLARFGVLYVYNSSDGSTEYSRTIGNDKADLSVHHVVMFDDSTDGDLDILVNGASGGKPTLYLYESSGTKLWERELEDQPYFSVGDIDADGDIEIVVLSGDKARTITPANTLIDSVSINVGVFVASPLLVDINGDSDVEIVTTSYYDIDPDTTEPYVPQQSYRDLSIIRIHDDELSITDTLTTVSQLRGGPVNAAISDVDDDGDPEVAFVSSDSLLHVLELGSDIGRREWTHNYNNAMNSNVYEQPIMGVYTKPVSLFNRVKAIGDVSFGEDTYINPGTDVFVSKTDTSIVIENYGDLDATGTEDEPIRFVAVDSTGTETTGTTDWWCIYVHADSADAAADFEHCIIRNSYRGIQTNVSISIEDCTIEMCDLIGVGIDGADSVYITDTTIRGAELAGIKLLQESTLQLTNSKIENIEDYGIEVHSDSKLYVNGTEFRDCDIGAYISPLDSLAVSADIDSCFFYSNETGIMAYLTSDVSVTNSVIDSNSTNGIYCLYQASIDIEDNTIRYNTIGIYCNDYSDATIKDNTIRYNTAGGAIKCDDYSHAVIEGNVITSNKVGIAAVNNASPDIGHTSGGLSQGNNEIHSNTSFYVANSTMGITLKAENNYWAGSELRYTNCICDPKPTKIYGSVDACDALCTAPASPAYEFVGDDPIELPNVYMLGQNYPNPFNPTTTIRYEVPPPGGHVSIVIYNVRGQRIATLVNSHTIPGYHVTTWNGANDRGGVVASGVYFVQMKSPSYLKSRKLLLLK
jgi:parallel beta-helix repeat protein